MKKDKVNSNRSSHESAGLNILKHLSRALGYDIKVWKSGRLVKRLSGPKNCKSRKLALEFRPKSGDHGQWFLTSAEANISENCLLDILKTPINIQTVRLAQYHGYSAKYAGLVLDRSHGATSDSPDRYKGYPRAYAVCDDDASYEFRAVADCIQKFSTLSPECQMNAFLSYRQQNKLAHAALRSNIVQQAIAKLNAGGRTEVRFQIPPNSMGYTNENMPMGCVWQDGRRGKLNIQMEALYMELRHHEGRKDDPEAELMVFIMYPLLKTIPELEDPSFFEKVKTGTPKKSKPLTKPHQVGKKSPHAKTFS